MTPEDLDKLEALAANPDAEFVTASVSDFRELIRLARLGAAATEAALGHDLLVWLSPGAVDDRHHNIKPDGTGAGDCYKCDRVAAWIAAKLREP